MSKTMGRPAAGQGANVGVPLTVPRELDQAVRALAAATGTSRMAIMRQALFAGLSPLEVVSPELAAALPATPYARKVQ